MHMILDLPHSATQEKTRLARFLGYIVFWATMAVNRKGLVS
jgi:hypothetical protein